MLVHFKSNHRKLNLNIQTIPKNDLAIFIKQNSLTYLIFVNFVTPPHYLAWTNICSMLSQDLNFQICLSLLSCEKSEAVTMLTIVYLILWDNKLKLLLSGWKELKPHNSTLCIGPSRQSLLFRFSQQLDRVSRLPPSFCQELDLDHKSPTQGRHL